MVSKCKSRSNLNSETGCRVWRCSPLHHIFLCLWSQLPPLPALLDTALETLWLTLVTEEEGRTSVDCEDFFQLFEEGNMLNDPGIQANLEFQQEYVLSYGLGRGEAQAQQGHCPHYLVHIQANSWDLFGLNICTTFYRIYSVSCDFQVLGPKKGLKELSQLNLHDAAARPGPHVAGSFLHPLPCTGGGWAVTVTAAGSPPSLLRRGSELLPQTHSKRHPVRIATTSGLETCRQCRLENSPESPYYCWQHYDRLH